MILTDTDTRGTTHVFDPATIERIAVTPDPYDNFPPVIHVFLRNGFLLSFAYTPERAETFTTAMRHAHTLPPDSSPFQTKG